MDANEKKEILSPNAKKLINALKAMEAGLKAPSPLSFEGNVSEKWKRWRQNFEIYSTAVGLTESAKEKQVAVLLHVIGEEAREKFNTFTLTVEQMKDSKEVLNAFENLCTPKTNETVESYVFFTRVQQEGESFVSYVTELKKLASTCNFSTLKERLIKDRIVCGIRDTRLKQRLLKEENLSLEKCIQMCVADELSEIQVKTMENANEKKEINEIRASRSGSNSNAAQPAGHKKKKTQAKAAQTPLHSQSHYDNQRPQQRTCSRCGRQHPYRQCPAYNKTCSACSGKNHFAMVCKKKLNNVNAIVEQSSYNKDNINTYDSMFIGATYKFNVKEQSAVCDDEGGNFLEMVQINKKNITVLLDTGANCNAISINTLLNIDKNIEIIKSTFPPPKAYGGSNIDILGTCDLKCKFKNREEIQLNFTVVKALNQYTIIGKIALQKLNLIKRVHSLTTADSLNCKQIVEQYSDVFKGTGLIKNYTYHIEIKKGVTGTIEPCRKVALSLMPVLEKLLYDMEKDDIVQRVNYPTQWVNPLVLAKKKNGKLRICLDPFYLNQCILKEHRHIPTFEEISSRMPNAAVFSTLDADQAFWQIKISEESSDLLTFNTPFGRFKFKRMAYGINTATEVFQDVMFKNFNDIEGVEIYIDDILIWGKDQKEHDFRVKKVLQRAREIGLRLNFEKCKFSRNEVIYTGHRLSAQGVSVDQDRVKAIVEMPAPSNKKELETFLGMITYVSRYIPHLSEVNSVLRNLIKKNSDWTWDANANNSFNQLKNLLIKAPVLRFYDINKPVVISADASQHGLGCVLLQENLPICYASRALTSTECNYAQIEKETLAIAFAAIKFHQYICGKEVVVESDHKPLESIFKKPLNKCPARIQRIRMRIQIYDLKVKYKPGKELLLADALSRAHLENDYSNIDLEKEIETYVCAFEQTLPISVEKKQELKDEINNDQEMLTLIKYINKGWPTNKSVLPGIIKPYHTFADELCIIDGLIFKGSKLVIPKNMRKTILNKIHYNHLGIEKCKLRAREIIFWPLLTKDIENLIKNCNVCNKYQKTKSKEPLLLREVPEGPWQTLGLDFFHFKGKEWILIIDYYSKYVEVSRLENLSGFTVISKLKSVFARHGIPMQVYADNGPPFNGIEIKHFAKEWGFKFDTSSPKYPQSNGMVERHIQTIKRMFKKIEETHADPYLALLEYRNTPIDKSLKSPNELMFGRVVRGIVPFRQINKDHVRQNNVIKNCLEEKQRLYKQQYDKNTHVIDPIRIGQTVHVRKEVNEPLVPGTITNKCDRPRSYEVELPSGNRIERNRRYIHVNPLPEPAVNDTFSYENQSNNLDYSSTLPSPSKDIVNKTGNEANANSSITTRSGRTVKPTEKTIYKDYVV